MRHLKNYWKLGKQIGVHFVLVFDVIRGKLSSMYEFVLLVNGECHLSYSLLCSRNGLILPAALDQPSLIVGDHVKHSNIYEAEHGSLNVDMDHHPSQFNELIVISLETGVRRETPDLVRATTPTCTKRSWPYFLSTI